MQVKQNLELKHFCPDFERVRQVLRGLGAVKEKEVQQKDFFYCLPAERETAGGRLKMRLEEGDWHLIYYVRPAFVAGQKTASDIRMHEANEGLHHFLEQSLGVKAVVEKTREVWRLEHTVFHLDRVTGVGDIFEIELQREGELTDDDHRRFAEYQAALLPHLGEAVSGSNVDLVMGKK